MTLRTLLDNYSMAQLALLSHVALLKFEDEEARAKQETSGKKKYLNKNNSEAYMLIASGILG